MSGPRDRMVETMAQLIRAEATRFDPAVRQVEDLDAEPAAAASFVVVATQGRGDRAALRAALLSGARYVTRIASRRKAAALKSLPR